MVVVVTAAVVDWVGWLLFWNEVDGWDRDGAVLDLDFVVLVVVTDGANPTGGRIDRGCFRTT